MKIIRITQPHRIKFMHGVFSVQITDRPEAVELEDSESGYDIELKDVTFGYRADQPILQVNSPRLLLKQYDMYLKYWVEYEQYWASLLWTLGMHEVRRGAQMYIFSLL